MLGSTITWKKKRDEIIDQSKTRNYVENLNWEYHGAVHKSIIYQRDYMGEEENPHNRFVQWHSQ